MPEIGHNNVSENLHQSAKDHLRAFVERLERLNEEKASLSSDIKEVYAEAKSNGFDTKALRKIISLRKKAEHERLEEEAMLATYMAALDMLPLFDEKRGDQAKAVPSKLEIAVAA